MPQWSHPHRAQHANGHRQERRRTPESCQSSSWSVVPGDDFRSGDQRTGIGGAVAELKITRQLPGITLSAPVPAWMLETWSWCGRENHCLVPLPGAQFGSTSARAWTGLAAVPDRRHALARRAPAERPVNNRGGRRQRSRCRCEEGSPTGRWSMRWPVSWKWAATLRMPSMARPPHHWCNRPARPAWPGWAATKRSSASTWRPPPLHVGGTAIQEPSRTCGWNGGVCSPLPDRPARHRCGPAAPAPAPLDCRPRCDFRRHRGRPTGCARRQAGARRQSSAGQRVASSSWQPASSGVTLAQAISRRQFEDGRASAMVFVLLGNGLEKASSCPARPAAGAAACSRRPAAPGRRRWHRTGGLAGVRRGAVAAAGYRLPCRLSGLLQRFSLNPDRALPSAAATAAGGSGPVFAHQRQPLLVIGGRLPRSSRPRQVTGPVDQLSQLIAAAWRATRRDRVSGNR